MKIQFRVGINGMPAILNFRADLLYGKNEKYSTHIFNYAFSLDKGGKVILPISFVTDFIQDNNLEVEIKEIK